MAAPALMMLLCTPLAAANEFDGLYYSKNGKKPDTCEAIKNEIHPSGMIIENGTIYKGESICKLLQPRTTEHGTQFIAECQSEGEPHRNITTLKKTPNGISQVTGEEKNEWVECNDGSRATSTGTGKSSWKAKRFSNGTVERTVSNTQGDQIIFACTNGGDGTIFVVLASQDFNGGNVDFIVDEARYNLMTWADKIEINSECNVCADHYYGLMKDIRKGRSMSVVPQGGQAVYFDISGAAKVFDQKICSPKGW